MKPLSEIISQTRKNISQDHTPPSSNSGPTNEPCRICGRTPSICNQLGVIAYEVPVGHPDFGKLFRCPNNPVEQDEEHQRRFRALSNLDAYENKTFANFESHLPWLTGEQQQSLDNAFRGAQNFAADPSGWLMIEGTYGCGKTHLAAAIGNERLARGDMVIFITTPDLLDHLRGTFGPNSEVGYDQLFERIRNVPLLILDDLGAENATAWAEEKLFQLLNHRYSHRLPTVITTNANLDALDPRVRSRLLDENVIHRYVITAPDYRSPSVNELMQITDLELYVDMTFESFDTTNKLTPKERESLQFCLANARRYAQAPQGWLLITGSFGVGKTHLAAAIANSLSATGHDVIFVSTSTLLEFLRQAMNADSPVSFDKRFHTIRSVPLLILDDLQTETTSTWGREKLFQILDYRYAARLPTVITSAKPLDKIDERLRVRFMDRRRCLIIALFAPDYASRLNRQ